MADAPAHHGAPAHPGSGKKSGTVDILGHPVKKSTALAGGLAAAAVVIIAIMRKRSAAQAADSSAAASGLVTDPAGNQCSTLNPDTGYCPGTPADVNASAGLSAGAALSSESGGGLSGGGGYYYEPTSTATGTSSTGSAVPAFTDNASWAQYAETALGSNGGDAIAAALAKYLSGQPVTTDQQTTIEEAIAIANYPPVAGGSGNPPGMTLSAASASTSTTGTTTAAGGTTSTATGTGSAATGTTTKTGTGSTTAALSKVTGGKAVTTANGATVTWTATGPATSWQVTINGPNENGKQAVVKKPEAVYSGLLSGHNYTVSVQPLPSGTGGLIEVKTK